MNITTEEKKFVFHVLNDCNTLKNYIPEIKEMLEERKYYNFSKKLLEYAEIRNKKLSGKILSNQEKTIKAQLKQEISEEIQVYQKEKDTTN